MPVGVRNKTSWRPPFLHILGHVPKLPLEIKFLGDEGGTALFLAAVGPEGAPEQAGRQNHPPTWEPENFRAFRPSPGQANTNTSVSLPTSAFKPGGGRHLLSGRRLGLRCLRGPRPRISCIDLAR